jgi:hypothetical protein
MGTNNQTNGWTRTNGQIFTQHPGISSHSLGGVQIVSYASICLMCCGWWHFCYRSLLAILRKIIGKPRRGIGNLNRFEYWYLSGLKVPYYSAVGTLPNVYIHNEPLPRIPRKQCAKSRVQVHTIPEYYKTTYVVHTYKSPSSRAESAAYAYSPIWHAIAINN